MRRIVKWVLRILAVVAGIAIGISVIEKRIGVYGWTKDHKPIGFYERCLKRPLDFFLSLLGVTVLWPVFVLLAVLVKVKLGSPVLFKQNRPGLNGEIFTLYKFRTMTDERDKDGNLLPDEERLTRFGRWLRSTSLDELPELFNILKGDMSVVGPRPLLVRYLSRYSAEQKHRHDVRPGLTGYAQSHGRNELSWDERFEDDISYVNHITFAKDIRIIVDTIRLVIKREGIHSESSETMEEFMGSSTNEE